MDKVQLKNKLHKLKLALTLSGILGGNALSANAVENNKTTDTSKTQYKTEVITKHINNQYTQKYIESGKQTTAFTKHGVTKDYHAASQILFDLGDGYFMISSKVVRQHTSPEKLRNNIMMSYTWLPLMEKLMIVLFYTMKRMAVIYLLALKRTFLLRKMVRQTNNLRIKLLKTFKKPSVLILLVRK